MPRIFIIAFVMTLPAALALLPVEAEAQFFWSPWFNRGYRPPPPPRETAPPRPWTEPRARVQPKKKPQPSEEEAAKAPPPQEERPVPYDGDLSRLAELLGALHYLRPLCGERDRERWRKEMQSLLESEHPTQARKDRLVASFNHGYQSYELTYRACTPSANLAIVRSLDEGSKLARDIATRYGN